MITVQHGADYGQTSSGSWQLVLAGCGLIAMGVPDIAFAQDGEEGVDNTIEAITVTARKREETLQEIPTVIDVFSGEQLIEQGTLRPSELQFAVPGFYVQNWETRATITMRGVGAQIPGATSAVATHINGVYQASAAAQLNRLFDIERVEVLKGPQGTLYGRNSTGGVLNIITRAPDGDFGANVGVSYGTFDTIQAEGGVAVPLGDTWSMRLAASYSESDGIYRNTITDTDIGSDDFFGSRVSLAGKIGEVEADLFYQFTQDDNNTQLTLIPVDNTGSKPIPLLGWDQTSFNNPEEAQISREAVVAGLTLFGEINDRYSWRSITGYLDYEEGGARTDVNPEPNAPVQLYIDFPQFAEQFSQELQLLYNGDRANWVLGAYYLDDERSDERFLDIVGVFIGLDSMNVDETEVLSVFGDLNYYLSDALTLNVGLRYNNEDVRNRFSGQGFFDPAPYDESGSQGDPTWRLGLDYALSDNVMVYGSVATAYQAGFFQTVFDPQGTGEVSDEVDPEDLTAFELGFKSVLPNDAGYFNASAFIYDYRDMQVLVGGLFLLPDGTPDPNTPPFFFTDNAAEAEIWGIDLQFSDIRFSDHFKMDLNAEYLRAEYEDYQTILDDRTPVNFSGNTLPRAPELTYSARFTVDNVQFGNGAEALFSLEYNYRDGTFFTRENDSLASQDAFGLLNFFASVDFADGRWSITASGRNLADKEFFDFYDGRNIGNTGEFRTWQIGFQYRYR